MKHYRILINGENFFIKKDNVKTYMGFYTTRFVSADDPDQAELLAIKDIQTDENIISITLNTSEHEEAMMYMDEINEIKEKEIENNYGFGWYTMDGSND